ncbi:MAG: hypothetical protein V4663_18345 [Bacteroidota bacterium]
MTTKTTGLATTAFLLIIVSVTELPYLLKYPMIVITISSLILSLYKIYKESKTHRLGN